MLTIRRADARPRTQIDWLDSRHTFSFGNAHDPSLPFAMGFRDLRVINDDVIAPSGGFGTHPHRDMEIISFVTRGALAHKDTMGKRATTPGQADAHEAEVRPGDVQAMTAGTGILHSEFNPSATDETRLLQVWILPREKGLTPRYDQKHFGDADRADRLRLVVSPDGREASITIQQDASIYSAVLSPGVELTHAIAGGRHAWVQVASGAIELNGERLADGDGAAVSDEDTLRIRGVEQGEVLVFDLA